MENTIDIENKNSMKRILIVCNTCFQIMFAIQLKESVFIHDSVDIGITDQISNSAQITNNLKNIELFNDCFNIQCRTLNESRTKSMKIRKLCSALFHNSKFEQIFKKKKYDAFLYYNISYSVTAVYNILIHNNPNLICSRFEEGILSYNTKLHERGNHSFGRFIDTLFRVRNLLGKQNIIDNIGNFYCFYPGLYKLNFQPVKVPFFSKNAIGVIAKIFNVHKEDCYIKEKYIFFSSVYDFEGEEPIGEFGLIKRISKLVGKDNFIIKKHPRDDRTIYEEAGFRVLNISRLPWEVCQLCFDYSNHILLSVNSGSLLSINLYTEHPIKSFYLYPCCDYQKNSIAKIAVSAIEKLFNNQSINIEQKNIKIISDIHKIIEPNGQ